MKNPFKRRDKANKSEAEPTVKRSPKWQILVAVLLFAGAAAISARAFITRFGSASYSHTQVGAFAERAVPGNKNVAASVMSQMPASSGSKESSPGPQNLSETPKTSSGPNQAIKPKKCPRVLYIPSRDILTGTESSLENLEERVKVLEAQGKMKKQQIELSKLDEELKMLPVQYKAQADELTGKATKGAVYQPLSVEKPSTPPTLVSIGKMNGMAYASFLLPLGEMIKASEHDRVGEYTLMEIGQGSVMLMDKKGESQRLFLKAPDRYPVYPSIFCGVGGSGPVGATRVNQNQPINFGGVPATQIPFQQVTR